jgi:hypothetical protein
MPELVNFLPIKQNKAADEEFAELADMFKQDKKVKVDECNVNSQKT